MPRELASTATMCTVQLNTSHAPQSSQRAPLPQLSPQHGRVWGAASAEHSRARSAEGRVCGRWVVTGQQGCNAQRGHEGGEQGKGQEGKCAHGCVCATRT